MKKIVFILISVSLTAFCYAQTNKNISAETAIEQAPKVICDSTWYPSKFISFDEAEKLFKKPVRLKDSLWKYSQGYLRYQFNYKAKEMDSITGLTGSLFFGLEQYEKSALAKRAYDLIKAENEKTGNVTILNDIGEDGFLTKDNLGNPFIMVRKKFRTYKFRMLYATGKNSNEELILIAKKIVKGH